ncbi:MAG: septal ring lytic transglycosylase RlpA family protein [Bacteroidales bacterium]
MALNKRNIFLLVILFLLINLSFAQEKYVQSGVASYYSDVFQGRTTACGEKYNNTLYTAAHATLPFHTLVKITNLKNNKTVIVKINDRCPKYPNRIIDLSKVAAKKLDILAAGIANVKLEVVPLCDLNVINNATDTVFNVIHSDTVH